MGDKISLSVTPRTVYGKKVRQLRRDGQVPAIIYGAKMEPLAIQAEGREMRRVTLEAGTHTPVHLSGAKRGLAIIKDIDYDHAKHGVIKHVAFQAIRANEPIKAEVPVRLTGAGESEAEKSGYIVLQAVEKIEVRALPADLPEAIEIDISGLTEIGDRMRLGDAVLPEGVEFVERDDGRREDEYEEEEHERQTVADLVVANVYEPAALEAANEASAGDAEDESAVETDEADEEATEESSDEESDAKSKPE